MSREFHLYYHRDFDGACSAAIFSEIVTTYDLVESKEFAYHPVDYHLKDNWLALPLEKPNAVLDFLFHPDAQWWYDHHVSAFLDPKLKRKYRNSVYQFWETSFQSCPALIHAHFLKHWPLFSGTLDRFQEWITWSNKIDSALYDSPAEVIELKHPCLQIYSTFGQDSTDEYLRFLIQSIRKLSPSEIASLDAVRQRFNKVKNTQDRIADDLQNEFEYNDGIVFLDQSRFHYPFQRYLSYYLYPDAHYTVAIYMKDSNTFSISVGKNPWKEFVHKNIGKLCEKYGGGGRSTVGGILCDDHDKSLEIARKIVRQLSR